MDRLLKLLAIVLLTQTLSCQKKMKELPEWKPSACNPLYTMTDERYSVQIGPNKITTLEGIYTGISDSRSSGNWGDSGAVSTSMSGTPIGADIIYLAPYEDLYYRVKINFDVEQMKKWVLEKHFTKESDIYDQGTAYEDPREGSFDGLVFGFAPQGMVVVWRSYSSHQIEIGRYQAEVIKNDKELRKLEKDMFPDNGMSKKDFVAMYVMPTPVTCEKWDNYRKRYNLKIEAISENKSFKLFESRIENYNGEFLFEFRPEILTQKYTSKALPNSVSIYWETGLKQKFQGNIFFNEKILFEKFKDVNPNENKNLQIKISQDNYSIEVLLDNEPIKMDSIRIWESNEDKIYNDSYK
jgi:hypothetical protein